MPTRLSAAFGIVTLVLVKCMAQSSLDNFGSGASRRALSSHTPDPGSLSTTPTRCFEGQMLANHAQQKAHVTKTNRAWSAQRSAAPQRLVASEVGQQGYPDLTGARRLSSPTLLPLNLSGSNKVCFTLLVYANTPLRFTDAKRKCSEIQVGQRSATAAARDADDWQQLGTTQQQLQYLNE